ncbi:MAG: DUF1353 domain-containing protein [Mariprofundaceae bacterium]
MMDSLIVKHISPSRWWRRARWQLIQGLEIQQWHVPAGFITDGASTPYLLAWLVSPTGKAMPAAVLHDYLLEKGNPRAKADRAFLRAMQLCGVSTWRRYSMWIAVRIYGIARELT